MLSIRLIKRKRHGQVLEKLVTAAVKVFLPTLSALFPIVGSLAGSPIFLAMTDEYSPETRRVLSWRVAFNSLFLLIGSCFIGAHVLNFFGVSPPVVQVGGGFVVVSMGWSMLMEKEEAHDVTRKNLRSQGVFGHAIYLLTLPLTVGPGSISVAVSLGADSPHPMVFTCGQFLQLSSPWS